MLTLNLFFRDCFDLINDINQFFFFVQLTFNILKYSNFKFITPKVRRLNATKPIKYNDK